MLNKCISFCSTLRIYSYSIWYKTVIKTFPQHTNSRVFCFEKSIPPPCKFDAYDLNGNMAISVEEFMDATKGFTKMDRKTLFERLDRNGKISHQRNALIYVKCLLSSFPGHVKYFRFISGDKSIGVGEFKYVPRSIYKSGILNHCIRMLKGGCIGICWG